MKNISSIAIICLYSLILYYIFTSCASVVPPTGGPRDTIPPKMIKSIPQNQSINYAGQVFYFEFDERIITENLRQKLIITPRIDGSWEEKPSKMGFRLIFEDPFEENLTYTFNFRDAVKDITEKNPTRDNRFTFSTGDYIDSISISGYITNLLKGDSLKEITVGIYKLDDTVNIFNGSPYYFTETNEKGKYEISNIKNGIYQVFAFKDANKNLTLQTNMEEFGFLPDTLNLQENVENLNIGLLKVDLRKLNLNNALASGPYFEINFNKYIKNYYVESDSYSDTIFYIRAKENRSVRVYNTFPGIDSLKIHIYAEDSIGDLVDSTLFMKFRETRRRPDEFQYTVVPTAKSAIDYKMSGKIQFNKPVRHTNTDSIFIQYDTTKIVRFTFDSTLLWNKNFTELEFHAYIDKNLIDSIETQKERIKLLETEQKSDTTSSESIDAQEEIKEETTTPRPQRRSASEALPKTPKLNKGIQLYLGKATFISIENDSSAQNGLNYEIIDPEKFGTIKGRISTEYKSYFIQLVNDKNEVIKELYAKTQYAFTNVPPGKYRIRILVDNNEDGKWDFGDMRKNIAPESVIFFTETLTVRANWEQQDIDISF
ncbi:MAG: Ig-like domain-containing protein [Cyclobacteriaceae bacterium]|nr:Ig-like domain-containing protein [Cyclobacteriaceae bacterium]